MADAFSEDPSASPAEVQAELEARRRGNPYLVYRDHEGHQNILSLLGTWDRVVIGRSMYADLMLSWDEHVSAVHAELERLADDWVLVDDGLSRNGSFVNGERVSRRRRLMGGDELRFGRTVVAFRSPFQAAEEDTANHEIPRTSGRAERDS
jgi:hypothetical protein